MAKRRHRALLAHFAAPNSTEKGHILPQYGDERGTGEDYMSKRKLFLPFRHGNKRTKGAGYTGKRSLSLPLGYRDVKERKTGLEYKRKPSLLSQLQV